MTAPGAQQPHPRATAMGATDSPRAPISIQWRGKLRNLLQAAAFCLLIAALLYALQPDRPWPPHVAYSLSIGLITWALIDLGRHAFPSARETGWPQGVWGFVLVAGSIAAGFFGGTALGGFVCESLGLYGGYPPAQDLSKEFRRTLLISVGAGLVGTFYFYSRSRGVYLERARAEAMRHATEARLKLLETQLEPHMLFNTLANLRALI
ncbi:MAG TPA: histidine kinase, partial [Ramlibacter sp.]|nr:histidine kinase [Ramlibacter sp.]